MNASTGNYNHGTESVIFFWLLARPCPALSTVSNGTWSVYNQSALVYGSRATLQCDVGYQLTSCLNNIVTVQCLSSGLWSVETSSIACIGQIILLLPINFNCFPNALPTVDAVSTNRWNMIIILCLQKSRVHSRRRWVTARTRWAVWHMEAWPCTRVNLATGYHVTLLLSPPCVRQQAPGMIPIFNLTVPVSGFTM